MEGGSGFYCYERGVCVTACGILMKSDSCYHGALHHTAFLVCVHVCLSRQASVPNVQGQTLTVTH